MSRRESETGKEAKKEQGAGGAKEKRGTKTIRCS